jgi:hypothetical protein
LLESGKYIKNKVFESIKIFSYINILLFTIFPKAQKNIRERIYAGAKKIFKAGKVLITTVQRVNLKMLCTYFFYNLYQLMALKIKRVFLE